MLCTIGASLSIAPPVARRRFRNKPGFAVGCQVAAKAKVGVGKHRMSMQHVMCPSINFTQRMPKVLGANIGCPLTGTVLQVMPHSDSFGGGSMQPPPKKAQARSPPKSNLSHMLVPQHVWVQPFGNPPFSARQQFFVAKVLACGPHKHIEVENQSSSIAFLRQVFRISQA